MVPGKQATGLEQQLRDQLGAAQRLVVKVGSQALCRPDGRLDGRMVAGLCQDLAALQEAGKQVVLVSSGAVASGLGEVGADRGLHKQALAAIGQPLLMARYRMEFAGLGRHVAQILLTHSDLANRSRFLHARRVMAELMAAGILPIVNENDTVAVDELKFGDNDQLAAQVAHVVEADALVLLTEVDGLFTADPGVDPTAQRISLVRYRDTEAMALAGDSKSAFGTGGMRSKMVAAQKAGAVGCVTVIARGKASDVLSRLLAGEDAGTVFEPAQRRLTGKRSWIATSVRPRGTVTVDAGAVAALQQGGRSLLLAGVTAVQGEFAVGDPLQVVGPDGTAVGRGLSRYDAEDARQVVGLRTEQVSQVLGWLPAAELIHRDDFVLS
jgi:glutamate 5-kinase